MIAVALSSMTATKRRDCLTLDGFCHLLDAIESEIKHSSARTPLHCYIEDSFPLPAGVYREIIESVFFFFKTLITLIVYFELQTKTNIALVYSLFGRNRCDSVVVWHNGNGIGLNDKATLRLA